MAGPMPSSRWPTLKKKVSGIFRGSLFHNSLDIFLNFQIFCLYIMASDFVFVSFLCMQIMCVSLYVSCAFLLAFISCSFCPFLVCFYLIFFLLIIINLDAYFYNNDGERKKGGNLGGWIWKH